MRTRGNFGATAIAILLLGCTRGDADNGLGFGDPTADATTLPSDDAPGESSTSSASTGAPAESSGAASTGDPATDDSSPDPTTPGTSTSDGDTASGSTEGGAAEGDPLPTYDYGQCNDGCPADMCITIQGFNGSFCTTTCVGGECPPAPDGDAVAQCLLGPDLTMPPINCVLTCSVAAQDCPGAMACVDAMMGGDAGICLWQ